MAEPRTWTLTGSPENHAAGAQHGRTNQGRSRLVHEHDTQALLGAIGARDAAGAGAR